MKETASTVLLVDDHPLLRKGVSQLLELEDDIHVVAEAANGEDAVLRALELDPDLILLDLELPEVSGLEVLSAIKQTEHLRAIPVIVLTRSEEDSDALQAYDLQANCYLNKPHNIEGFIEIARTIAKLWLRHIPVPRPDGNDELKTMSRTESATPPGSDSD